MPNFREHFVFWILPGGFGCLLVAGYYFGPAWVEALVAGKTNREYGLAEMLQNLLILLMLICCVFGWQRASHVPGKAAFGLLGLFSLFILLEETNYGWGLCTPCTDLLSSLSAGDKQVQTLHHVRLSEDGGSLRHYIKDLSNALIIFGFFLFPLTLYKLKNPLLRYLLPRRLFATTALAMLVVSKFAHAMQDATDHSGVLDGNISEFRELLTYYLFFLYLFYLVRKTGVQPVADQQASQSLR